MKNGIETTKGEGSVEQHSSPSFWKRSGKRLKTLSASPPRLAVSATDARSKIRLSPSDNIHR